jgi:hypothetical protein
MRSAAPAAQQALPRHLQADPSGGGGQHALRRHAEERHRGRDLDRLQAAIDRTMIAQ